MYRLFFILRPKRSLYLRPRGHLLIGRPCKPHQGVKKVNKILLLHAERSGATPEPTPGHVRQHHLVSSYTQY